mgnify:CR=1 FL=1
MTDSMQIVFTTSEREKRQAGRRLFRYREPALRQKYWLGMAAFILVIIGLCYFYGLKMAEIYHVLYGNCYAFAASADMVEDCVLAADNAGQRLQYLLYLLLGIVIMVTLHLRWQFAYVIHSAWYPLDGRSFTITVSPEGLMQEEAGRERRFHYWPAVYRLIEDKDFLFFYVDRNIAYFIPLSAFAAAGMESHAFFLRAQQFKEHA